MYTLRIQTLQRMIYFNIKCIINFWKGLNASVSYVWRIAIPKYEKLIYVFPAVFKFWDNYAMCSYIEHIKFDLINYFHSENKIMFTTIRYKTWHQNTTVFRIVLFFIYWKTSCSKLAKFYWIKRDVLIFFIILKSIIS